MPDQQCPVSKHWRTIDNCHNKIEIRFPVKNTQSHVTTVCPDNVTQHWLMLHNNVTSTEDAHVSSPRWLEHRDAAHRVSSLICDSRLCRLLSRDTLAWRSWSTMCCRLCSWCCSRITFTRSAHGQTVSAPTPASTSTLDLYTARKHSLCTSETKNTSFQTATKTIKGTRRMTNYKLLRWLVKTPSHIICPLPHGHPVRHYNVRYLTL